MFFLFFSTNQLIIDYNKQQQQQQPQLNIQNYIPIYGLMNNREEI